MMWRVSLAYVDPSVMTYTVQALAAVAVAFSAIAGVAMRRTRKTLFRLLGIDENAGRVVEARAARVGEDGLAAADARAREMASALDSKGAKTDAPLPWRRRLPGCLAVAAFLVFTVLVVAPLEVVAGGSADLIFGLGTVAPPVFAAAALAAVALALALSLARGRAHALALAVTAALGVAAWIQALLLNKGLPLADGYPVDWSLFDKISLVSTLAWAAIIACAVAFALARASLARVAAIAVAVALSVVQAAGLASAWAGASASLGEDGEIYVTEKGLFDVSPASNVIVFIVDTVDTKIALDVAAREPGLLDGFDGFTWFTNSTGSMIPTRYAMPALLTGVHPNDPDERFQDFMYFWYDKSSFMDQMKATGYSLGVYSGDVAWTSRERERFASWTINYRSFDGSGDKHLDALGTVGALWRCGLYRDLPWPLKRFAWYYTDELNSAMVDKRDEGSQDVPYLIDDPLFNAKLLDRGLALNDDATGSFRLIHLLGSHDPYIMDRHARDARPGWTTMEEQTLGVFTILRNYFAELKRLGAYDEATIIVTADHGDWSSSIEKLAEPTNPVLMVKPRQSAEEAARPLVRSDAPVSHWDLQATMLEAMGAAPQTVAQYGVSVWNVPKERKRLFYMTVSTERRDSGIVEVSIEGDAQDFSAWHPTGRVWDVTWR